jgi:hypothetical protein
LNIKNLNSSNNSCNSSSNNKQLYNSNNSIIQQLQQSVDEADEQQWEISQRNEWTITFVYFLLKKIKGARTLLKRDFNARKNHHQSLLIHFIFLKG